MIECELYYELTTQKIKKTDHAIVSYGICELAWG